MLENLLFALSIRFFLFDFILFKHIREYFKKQGYVFRKLFSCAFCQGFWCGIVVYLFFSPFKILALFKFAFISALLSLTWTIWIYPLIKEYEEEQDLPMT